MKRSTPILSLLLLAVTLPLWGQYHASYTYTTKQGLISSEIFDVFVDSRGLVWAASGSGVSCFDGRSFRNFTIKEGLAFNHVLKIFEDGNGRIWMQHQDAQEKQELVSFWDGKKLRIVDIGRWTGVLMDGKLFWNSFQRKVQFATGGELWSYEEATGAFVQEWSLPCEILTNRFVSLYPDPFQDRFLILVTDPDKKETYVYSRKDQELRSYPSFPELFPFIASLPNGDLLARTTRKAYRLDPGLGWQPFSPEKELGELDSFPVLPSNVIYVDQQEQGRSWLVEVNAAAPQGVHLPIRVHSNFAVAARAPDGTYWVGSRNGLIHIFPAFLDCLADDLHPYLYDLHTVCEDRNGKVWFGSYSNGFSFFDGRSVHPGPAFLKDYSTVLPGVMRDAAGRMYYWVQNMVDPDDFSYALIRFDGVSPAEVLKKDMGGYYFHQAWDGQVGLGLSYYGLGLMNPGSGHIEIIGRERGHNLINVLTTVKDRYGRWWMGRFSTGLAYYDTAQDTIYSWLRSDTTLSFGLMSSAMDSRGNLWLGASDGLRFFANREHIDPATFDPEKEFIPVGREEMGGTMVQSLILYDDSTLIASNQLGLALIDLNAFYETGKAAVYFLTEEDGYTGNGADQNSIWIDSRKRVWVASDLGAHRFDPRLFIRGAKAPVPEVDSLVYEGRSYRLPQQPGEEIRLARGGDNSQLKVCLRPHTDSIRSRHVFYVYKFDTDSAFSKPVAQAELPFANLAPGAYTLQIKAKKDGQDSAVREVRFYIPRALWSTPWPYLAISLVFAGSLWVFYRTQSRQKMEKNRLQVQAIVNQLNPHFINNALHWVQIRVYKDQDAVAVISKLGENIRLVFRNTRAKRSFHPLQDELQLVKNYLFIQKHRFGDHLSYSLPEPEQIAALGEVEVLLMQVQIHCENAVEHGIRNKEEPGKVAVEVHDEGSYVHIVVEDDGVGRKKAAELGSKGTQQGTKMLNNLRDILNPHNELPLIFQYEDEIFTNDRGLRYGTRVHIRIPKNYRYAFHG